MPMPSRPRDGETSPAPPESLCRGEKCATNQSHQVLPAVFKEAEWDDREVHERSSAGSDMRIRWTCPLSLHADARIVAKGQSEKPRK